MTGVVAVADDYGDEIYVRPTGMANHCMVEVGTHGLDLFYFTPTDARRLADVLVRASLAADKEAAE